MYIMPYKNTSNSARLLAKELNIKRIKVEGSRFKGDKQKVVINWGCSEVSDEVKKCHVINMPSSVGIASNKLSFFNCVFENDLSIPEWTTFKQYASNWLDDGMVVCRTILNGHSGAGIVLARTVKELVDAPLYVKYIPKKDEYRIHVGDCGETVIDVQKKARRNDVPKEQANFQIRNHANGFIYMREDVNPPEKVLTYAKECVRILGLNFGAVDVIWNDKRQEAYVLEVNTAPGLVGTTLKNYVNYFKRHENHR